jgi:hypothetical protein
MPEANWVMPAVLGALLGGAVMLLLGSVYLRRRIAELDEAHGKGLLSLEQQSDQRLSDMKAEAQAEAAAKLNESEQRHAVTLRTAEHRHAMHIAEIQSANQAEMTTAMRDAEGRHVLTLHTERDQLLKQYQDSLRGVEQRHDRQMKKVESPLTVVVHPFVNSSTDKGLIRSSTVVEMGYKYQLHIQGVPCFPPHDVVVERQANVEIDKEAIAAMGKKAIELAEAAVQSQGGGLAGKLITVAKTVVLSRK